MNWREQLAQLAASLGGLGARRLAVLGIAGVLVAALVGVSGYLLTRPTFEVLYTQLEPRDVTAIGAALGEAGIRYDVSADGRTIKVAYGEAARARMLLAEKGLPRSARAGYELFDNIGALGLTSFMQEVTLVRALEGELSRTIQNVQGVRAARVHIVLPKKYNFRRDQRQPSASVLVHTDSAFRPESAEAIRYLVAGAVPGLSVARVTVLDTNGALLASGDDRNAATPRRLVDLENTVSARVRENVMRALAPYLGPDNFQVAVSARLDTDKRRISEVIYDPKSRVERSIRNVKEKSAATNGASSGSVSVDQEIPGGPPAGGGGEQSKEKRDRKEQIVNYEISSKRVETVSDGYRLARLSIAVVVNRKSLETLLGRKPTEKDIQQRQKEIRALVATAAGLDAKRGDTVQVGIVDFMQAKQPLEPVSGPGFMASLAKLMPSLINALALIGVAALIIWFGVRPAINALTAPPAVAEGQGEGGIQAEVTEVAAGEQGAEALPAEDSAPELGAPPQHPALEDAASAQVQLAQARALKAEADDTDTFLAELLGEVSRIPLKRLQQMIEYDERQAAAVIRDWLREEAS